jgi:hypothetical protein
MRACIVVLVAAAAIAAGGPSAAHATPLARLIDLQEEGLQLSWDAEGLAGWDGSRRR